MSDHWAPEPCGRNHRWEYALCVAMGAFGAVVGMILAPIVPTMVRAACGQ